MFSAPIETWVARLSHCLDTVRQLLRLNIAFNDRMVGSPGPTTGNAFERP
jgi:hypothetical protein